MIGLELNPEENADPFSQKVFRQTSSRHRIRVGRRKSSSKLKVIPEASCEEDNEETPKLSQIINNFKHPIICHGKLSSIIIIR
jgi:hypothetical protein